MEFSTATYDRIEYFQSKTNGAVFDENCNQMTDLDYPDLYYYDRDAALWVCEFMETTGKIVEDGHNFSKGDPIKLLPWQIQTICNLFGVKQKKNKLRRYWYCLQFLPKKQGKSPFSALIGIYLTAADQQGRGQIFTVASDKMQAKIIHENAKEMIKADPWLTSNLTIRRDHILHPYSSSTFWVTSAVEDTKHGPNLSAILGDEPHTWKDGELDKTLTKGIIARPEPVVMYTSTAGVRGCWFHMEKYDYARSVKNGIKRDDRWLVFIYEPDIEAYIKEYGEVWDDEQGLKPWWAYERVWKDVNPSYGVTVTKDYFDNQVTLVKNSPGELNAFLRLHLNVFTGTTVAWSITRSWHLCNGEVSFDDFKDKRCFVSLYRSRPHDMVCFSLYHEEKMWWKCLITEESAEDRAISTPGFQKWIDGGHVEIIEDSNHISTDDQYDIMCNYLDQLSGIAITYRTEDSELGQKVGEKYNMELNPVSLKGKAITTATTTFENKINEGQINHGSNPIMTYQVNMTEIVMLDDISRPSSEKSRDNICCVFAGLFNVMASAQEWKQISPTFTTGIDYA